MIHNRSRGKTAKPQCAESRKSPPKWRSMNSPDRNVANGGNAISTISDVITMFQVKMGTRHIVMPGARSMNTVAMMLTAVMMLEADVSNKPMITMSMPVPWVRVSESGGYIVQPVAGAPCGEKNDR